MNYGKKSLDVHKKKRGKIEIKSKVPLKTKNDLSIAYTPGVGAVSLVISKNKKKSWQLTNRANQVAIVSDGSAIVVLAALINACRVEKRNIKKLKIIINGAGAAIVGTGRSDLPNQINNALVFPGLFRGLLGGRIKKLTNDMKVAVAEAIAYSVKPTRGKLLPKITDKKVAQAVAEAVKQK